MIWPAELRANSCAWNLALQIQILTYLLRADSRFQILWSVKTWRRLAPDSACCSCNDIFPNSYSCTLCPSPGHAPSLDSCTRLGTSTSKSSKPGGQGLVGAIPDPAHILNVQAFKTTLLVSDRHLHMLLLLLVLLLLLLLLPPLLLLICATHGG
jgi:hypothetical protein